MKIEVVTFFFLYDTIKYLVRFLTCLNFIHAIMDKSVAQGFDIQQNSVLSSMNYAECILQQGFTIIRVS